MTKPTKKAAKPAKRTRQKPGPRTEGAVGDPDAAPPTVGGKEISIGGFDTHGNPTPKARKTLTNGESILAFSQKRIEELYGEKEWHPAVFLIVSSANPNLTWEQRALAARSSMPFLMPTLKSVEVKGDAENPLVVEVRDTRRRMFEKLGMTEYLDENGDLRPADVEG